MQLPSWLQLHPAQFILYSPERNVTVKYRNADQRLPSLPNSSCQRNTLRPHPGQPTILQAFSLGQRKQAGRVRHVGTQADVVIWTCVDVQQALIRAICGNQLRPGHNCTQRHHLVMCHGLQLGETQFAILHDHQFRIRSMFLSR